MGKLIFEHIGPPTESAGVVRDIDTDSEITGVSSVELISTLEGTRLIITLDDFVCVAGVEDTTKPEAEPELEEPSGGRTMSSGPKRPQ